MVVEKLNEGYQPQPRGRANRFQRNIPKAQEVIYNYLLEIVKEWSPEEVLAEFRHLFIHHVNTISSHTLPSLYEIVFANQETEFRNTLKRSCYILINNWDLSRNHESIRGLVQLFNDPILDKPTMSPTLRRLRGWLKNFVESEDFQELKLFASRYDEQRKHWSDRYTSYLLVPQYIDLNNPIEQRNAARTLSKQLKERFKFELAMYTARSQSNTIPALKPKNPTMMGDDVLRLVKMIVAKRGNFSYANLAHIFLNQTRGLRYQEFKESLKKYLVLSSASKEQARSLNAQVAEKLDALYVIHHDKPLDDALLLRTVNRIISYLTTENQQDPSPLFVQLLMDGNPLTLVIVLLKLVLICPYARTHLEARIANLVQFYKAYPEDECRWVINFFEIFDITMAIYAENIEFNLVDMRNPGSGQHQEVNPATLDAYRVFSQIKHNIDATEDLEQMEQVLSDLMADDDSLTSEEITELSEAALAELDEL
ncbi:MAG: hypothetical protein SNJ57_11755 [Cyanobacteriota bacterium]